MGNSKSSSTPVPKNELAVSTKKVTTLKYVYLLEKSVNKDNILVKDSLIGPIATAPALPTNSTFAVLPPASTAVTVPSTSAVLKTQASSPNSALVKTQLSSSILAVLKTKPSAPISSFSKQSSFTRAVLKTKPSAPIPSFPKQSSFTTAKLNTGASSSTTSIPTFSNTSNSANSTVVKTLPIPLVTPLPIVPKPSHSNQSSLTSPTVLKTQPRQSAAPVNIAPIPKVATVTNATATSSKNTNHLLTKPIVLVNRLVTFDSNNYIILKTNGVPTEYIHKIDVPFKSYVDKFQLRVCPQYNGRLGCFSKYCYRFHVCLYWVLNVCKDNDSCRFNHDFDSIRNANIVEPFKIKRGFNYMDFRATIKLNTFHSKPTKTGIFDLICVEGTSKKCKINSCRAIHSNFPFIWEIFIDNQWVRLIKRQSDEIEANFCDPQNTTIVLNPLLQNKKRKPKINFFDKNSIVNFEKMSITSKNSQFEVRRLSTPSDVAVCKPVATRWLWYWEDNNGKWQYFTSGMQKTYFVIPLSDFIESEFLRKLETTTIAIGNYCYTIDFKNMTQTNKETSMVRRLRRRPANFVDNKWKDNSTFRSLWSNLPPNTKFVRTLVINTSPEFAFVENMFRVTLPLITDLKIERIQNIHLWEAYQIKKTQMFSLYEGNVDQVNEQYLFHGTNSDVIEKICSDSFDWRLFGSSTGNIYGQGTYFSNISSYSNSYASKDNEGYSCMFVALVLIGTTAIGDSKMNFPPMNSITSRRFDTTVDQPKPRIFVKYNVDEYYPAYLAKYKLSI